MCQVDSNVELCSLVPFKIICDIRTAIALAQAATGKPDDGVRSHQPGSRGKQARRSRTTRQRGMTVQLRPPNHCRDK